MVKRRRRKRRKRKRKRRTRRRGDQNRVGIRLRDGANEGGVGEIGRLVRGSR